jgi:hypothetical protein
MKTKIFIFCLFICIKANCQPTTSKVESNTINVGLSKEELTIACNAYKNMLETDAYLENEKKKK